MPSQPWEERDVDFDLPTNRALYNDGYSFEEFKAWKEFFGKGGCYVKEWIIPVPCKCRANVKCYKHRMEDLRALYAKPMRNK